MAHYDVAVIGLGAAGSAALRELARRGVRAVGIERFAPGHDRGSSHGETRMIRLGYFEHPSYVPLLRRAYPLWRALEQESGQSLLHVTGIAEIGRPDSEVVSGTLRAAREHDLPHERLDADEAMRRFPAFRLPPDYVCVHQPDGGFVSVEPSLAAMLHLARRDGATVLPNEAVRAVIPQSAGVRVMTEQQTIEAGAAIVAAGAWTASLLPDLPLALRPTRQVMAWFAPADPAPLRKGRLPVFLLQSPHGVHYGFPLQDDGCIKLAKHGHADEATDPNAVDRTVSPADAALIRSALDGFLPAARGALVRGKTCLYTMTGDGDFLIDRPPGAGNVVAASACSGHGFKFAPVLGEILADLALERRTPHDIARFSLARGA